MTSSLELAGFDLTAPLSPRGGRFRLKGLDGWLTVTQARDRQEKMQQPGAWPSTGFATALQITATGTATYSTPEDAALERRELLGLAGPGRYPMTVVDAAGPGTRLVEIDSLSAPPITDRRFAWALSATATDPILYGPDTYGPMSLTTEVGTGRVWPRVWPRDWGVPDGEMPGAVFVPNAGNRYYYPTIQVDGGVSNPSITVVETGAMIRYRGTIDPGQYVEFDPARRRAVLRSRSADAGRGVSVRQNVSYAGDWPAIPPGGAYLTATADAYGPTHLFSVFGKEGAWA